MYISWTYFSVKNVPVTTGSILFFGGFGAMILGPISDKILNPEKIMPDTDPRVAVNVPKLFRYLSIYFFG